MHVVGVVREVPEFLFVSDGQVLVPPGFLAKYGKRIQTAENADVALRHGAADMGALRHDVNKYLVPGTPVLDSHATSRRVNTTLAVETTALLLLAAAILLGGGILVAQVLGRSASAITDDALVLRALGMSRNQLGLATGLVHLLPAVLAGAVAFGVALVASARFPVGLGRHIDPDVGYHVDWTVVGPGMALVVLAVLVASVLIGRGSAGGRALNPRPFKAPGAFRRWAPAAIGLGTTMAFEPGRGRRRIPVLPALLAATIAVTGVVASLSIDRGIANALGHPELAGVTFDAGVTPALQAQTGRNVSSRAGRSHCAQQGCPRRRGPGPRRHQCGPCRGAGLFGPTHGGGVWHTHRFHRDSRTGAPGARRGGHRPRHGQGSPCRHRRHCHGGCFGRPRAHRRRGALPERCARGVRRGPLVGAGGVRRHRAADQRPGLPQRRAAGGGSLRPGRSLALLHHASAGRPGAPGPGRLASEPAGELTNLRNVRTLPEVLAAFLGLIAVAALGSVLLSCARRRSHEFAVLRALGMTRGNIRTVLNSQGTAIALFGLVVGIPLGLAVGRLGWRAIADRVPLSEIAPFAVAAALILIPVTLVAANLLAVWPGHVTLSRHPAEDLRAE